MPGHDVLAHLGGVAGEFPDIVDLADVTASTTLDLGGRGIARVTGTSVATITLPDAGFLVVIKASGATITVVDTDGALAMSLATTEVGVAIRSGSGAWHGVILGTGGLTSPVT